MMIMMMMMMVVVMYRDYPNTVVLCRKSSP